MKVYDIKEGKHDVIDSKSYHLRPKVPYYTFATVIQDMKEKRIGRPSTYAITVQKLMERHYIIERNGYLFPTKLGRLVLSLIKKREDMYQFVNEEYTKELEEIMDKIQENKEDYEKVLAELFNKIIKKFKLRYIRYWLIYIDVIYLYINNYEDKRRGLNGRP